MTEVQTVIPAGVDPVNYHRYISIRSMAETGDDPEAYERAARALTALGMTCAAERCREREKHYKALFAKDLE
jgi:hypothetical protein